MAFDAVRITAQLGRGARVFLIGNGVRILQPLEFLEFIGHAESNDLTKLIASLLGPLVLPLRHPAVLRDQIDEHPQIGEQDQHYHPNHLAYAGYVPSAKQVTEDRDQQPKPQHEDKYREHVGQKVGNVKPPGNNMLILPI
jgi:hypothetical protein